MKQIAHTSFLLLALLLIEKQSFSQNWQLVWQDEFTNGIGPDWVFETGNGASGWGNNELQYYRPENVSVQNGQLVITAKHESFGGFNYTSVRMKTQGRKSWKYGKIEARIAMPAFQGVWPAFWMLGDNITTVGWPACGEIDVMEHINTENRSHGTIHWANNNNDYASYTGSTPVAVTGFHVYSIEWNASAIKWFVDGVQFHEANIAGGVNGTHEFHNNFFILLNMAIGGNWPGFTVDNSAFPANMYVDYVRVYQEAGGNTGVATMYQDCNYGGNAVSLPAGSYTLSQLTARGIPNDYISSLKVQSGYKVTLYWDDNFSGSTLVKTADDNCLVDDGWNDKASSLVISANTSSTLIQAENFSNMSGVQTEATTDAGGGLNVGYIDAGDWMAYNNINFPASGSYLVEYRVASLNGGGQLSLDLNAGSIVLGSRSIDATGGWQSWTTVSHTVTVAAGTYNVGIYAQAGGWNINWFRITYLGSSARTVNPIVETIIDQPAADVAKFDIWPNPVTNELRLVSGEDIAGGLIRVFDITGRQVITATAATNRVDVSRLTPGIYTLLVTKNGKTITKRFIK